MLKQGRFLSLILTAAMLTLLIPALMAATTSGNWADHAALSFAGGDGSEGNPYQIATAPQLALLANDVKAGTPAYSGAHFKLTADIDLDGRYWTPIGDPLTVFTGVFDGNYKRVEHITINASAGNQGLFGYVKNAEIKNLGVSGTITGTHYNFGGIAGNAENSVVDGCYNEANLTGWGAVGGVVGNLRGSQSVVKNCYNTGTISGNTIGGVVGEGRDNSWVINCYNTGNVGNNSNGLGGIVGKGETGPRTNIKGCFNMGAISGSNNGETKVIAGNTQALGGSNYWGNKITDCGYLDTMTLTVNGSPVNLSEDRIDTTNYTNGAAAKTAAQLKMKTTYTAAGWEFMPDGPWSIDAGTGYPMLDGKDIPLEDGTVIVAPKSADVFIGGTMQFYATVAGDETNHVTWSVTGDAPLSGTFISADGLLTVGANEPSVTLTVTATSTFNGIKSDTASVNVITPHIVSVAVSPVAVTMQRGGARQFSAKVTVVGDLPSAVSWSLSGDKTSDETILVDGLLTVGADETASRLTVRATSTADSGKYGEAAVTVAPDEYIYNSVGLGTVIRLYPTNKAALSLPEDGSLTYYGNTGIADSSNPNGYKKGPFTIYDTAKEMNRYSGTAIIRIGNGGQIEKTKSEGHTFAYYVDVRNGINSCEYIPKKGLLSGVETQIKFSSQTYGTNANSKGMDAIVKYDGGQEKRIEAAWPDGIIGPNGSSTGFSFAIDETFLNLESVTFETRSTGFYSLPMVELHVVNEKPGSVAPVIPRRTYERPDISTVTPDEVIPVPVPNAESVISVNEACASNKTGLVDKLGKRSDWIELYNSSGEPFNIGGYGLTDNPGNLSKWKFPGGTTVPSGGYLTVIASGENTVVNGEIHTSFSLDKEGEPVILSDLSGNVISVITFKALGDDKTISRYPDGGKNLFITDPTHNAANSSAGLSYVAPPEFSADSGFYTDAFDLNITAANGTIYYTVDGSDPAADNVGVQWPDPLPDPLVLQRSKTFAYGGPLLVKNVNSQPNYYSIMKYDNVTGNQGQNVKVLAAPTFIPSVNVKKTMVVRAVAVDGNGNKSDIVTKTYFVGYDMANDFNNVAVLSVSTDPKQLFDTESKGIFVYTDGTDEEYRRRAHLDMFESNGSLVIGQDCDISIRGLGSRTNNQKQLNFHANKEYGSGKFKYPIFPNSVSKVDGSLVEAYDNFSIMSGHHDAQGLRYLDGSLQYLSRELDTAWQAHRCCVVFLNGEYWGQYYLEERATDNYVEQHYGVPKENILLQKNWQVKGSSTNADMDKYSYPGFLENTDFTKPENLRLLEERYDIKNMMTFYAVNMAMINNDFGAYNFVWWRSKDITDKPYEDGKWRFLLYDVARTAEDDYDLAYNMNHAQSRAMLTNETLRNQYINALCEVLMYTYDVEKQKEEYRYMHQELTPLLQDLKDRWGFTSLNAESYKNRDSKISQRPVYFYNILNNYLNSAEEKSNFSGFLVHYRRVTGNPNAVLDISPDVSYLNVSLNNSKGGAVKVNTITPDFTYGSYTCMYFKDIPQTLTAIPNPGYTFAGWTASDGTTISSGTDESIVVNLAENGTKITANFQRIKDEGAPDGDGTADYPFQIETEQHLSWMANAVNNMGSIFADNYYVLTDDIVVAGSGFVPIGTESSKFSGVFDGQFHTISNLNITAQQQGSGLFGYVGSEGIVKNVGVENIKITSTDKNVGGIAGNNWGLIENCYSTGSLTGISTVGGIVGNNSGPRKNDQNYKGSAGIIRNCYSTAAISNSGSTGGGIAGKTEFDGSVINSYSLFDPVVAKIADGGIKDEFTSSKPENDFLNGVVVSLLNAGADIWLQGESFPVFFGAALPSVRLTYAGGVVTIANAGDIESAKIIVASYDGALLTDIAILDADIENGTAIPENFTADAEGKIKIMLVNSVNILSPLCKGITAVK